MTEYSEQLERLHTSSKINGLLQAQTIALNYAIGAGPMSEFAARQIADKIAEAARAEQAPPSPPMTEE